MHAGSPPSEVDVLELWERRPYRPHMPTREEARRMWPHHPILEVIGPDGVSRFEPVYPTDDCLDLLLDGCTLKWPSAS